ncbi:MAG: hypothetical protein ACI9SQ_000641 [Rubritalea sp.]|jgi:hypothetical protein
MVTAFLFVVVLVTLNARKCMNMHHFEESIA